MAYVPMKTIIAGGRNYVGNNEDSDFLHTLGITEVISGGCSGADFFGEKWAIKNHIPIRRIAAEWDKYGKNAGPIRNKAMASIADAVVLFPGGKGTANMRKQAKQAGIAIHEK